MRQEGLFFRAIPFSERLAATLGILCSGVGTYLMLGLLTDLLNLHPLDVRSEFSEFIVDHLVSAIDVVNAINLRLAVGE